MKKDIWFPLYVNDYLGDTMHLTAEQHGVYMLLLMSYYRNGGPLPDSLNRLAATAKLSPKEFKDHVPVMAEFFHISDGFWHHKRADEEIKESRTRREKAKNAADARYKKERLRVI